MKKQDYNTTGNPTSYKGLYNDLLRKEPETYTKGPFNLKEGELHFNKFFKTYPTHRVYGVHVHSSKPLNQSEKMFFRDYLYSLVTDEHDFTKPFKQQVSNFYKHTRVSNSVGEDGKPVQTYELSFKKPVKLKLEEFTRVFQGNKSDYKRYRVSGKGKGMGVSNTKLRTKEDTVWFEKYNESLKMVA